MEVAVASSGAAPGGGQTRSAGGPGGPNVGRQQSWGAAGGMEQANPDPVSLSGEAAITSTPR